MAVCSDKMSPVESDSILSPAVAQLEPNQVSGPSDLLKLTWGKTVARVVWSKAHQISADLRHSKCSEVLLKSHLPSPSRTCLSMILCPDDCLLDWHEDREALEWIGCLAQQGCPSGGGGGQV